MYEKKALRKIILKNVKLNKKVKCIINKSVFIGFTKCQRSIVSTFRRHISANISKNDKINYSHCNNQRPRLVQAKVFTTKNKIKNKIIFINYKYSKILSKNELEKRRHQRHQRGPPRSKRQRHHKKIDPKNRERKAFSLKRSKSINDCKLGKLYNLGKRLVTLSGDVELNPGPNQKDNPNNTKLRVMTYNVQGLGANAKLKRVNNILHKLDHRESHVINIQETHFKMN